MNRSILKIEGMSCQHCVRAVEEALREVEGVGEMRVEVGRAEVEHDPAAADAGRIATAVREAGYHVVEIGREP